MCMDIRIEISMDMCMDMRIDIKQTCARTCAWLVTEVAQVKIVQQSGLDPIFALLRGGNKDAQRQAARALAHLSENEANKPKIIQQGGLRQFLVPTCFSTCRHMSECTS